MIKTNKAGDERGRGGGCHVGELMLLLFIVSFGWKTGAQGVGVSSRQVLVRWVGSLGAERGFRAAWDFSSLFQA